MKQIHFFFFLVLSFGMLGQISISNYTAARTTIALPNTDTGFFETKSLSNVKLTIQFWWFPEIHKNIRQTMPFKNKAV